MEPSSAEISEIIGSMIIWTIIIITCVYFYKKRKKKIKKINTIEHMEEYLVELNNKKDIINKKIVRLKTRIQERI